MTDDNKSFWEHLDELRSVLIRCAVAWAVCMAVMFCLREPLFDLMFAPARSNFLTYRLLQRIGISGTDVINPMFINTRLAAQFTTHLEVAAVAGLVVAFPYLIYQIYSFVSPALYKKEKRAVRQIVGFGTILFLVGVALNYFIIFPFAFRFLSTYQVQADVVNQIALESYVYTLLVLSLAMGLMFELPIVALCLSKIGLIDHQMLAHYRRHAFVGLTIIAAVITPTGDAVTLMLVTLPLYLLYELSIAITRRTTVKD